MAQFPGTPGDDLLVGTAEADSMSGGAGNDRLYSGGGADTLDGGEGNDVLDGEAGADTMTGGSGNDVYFVDNGGDLVIEAAGGGSDKIFTTIGVTLSDNIERVAVLDRSSTYRVDLAGNALSNEIIGNDGVNVLYGMGGGDSLHGAGGDDIYVIRPGDQVHDHENGGFDTVLVDATTSASLHAGFDYSLLTGERQFGRQAQLYIEAIGIYDRTSINSVNLEANSLDNILYGNNGINILEGWFGNDTMYGYGGDDIYFVHEAGDRVFEQPGDGYDTIFLGTSSSASGTAFPLFVLPDNVERVTPSARGNGGIGTLHGNALANEITGDANNNRIDGKEGRDILVGGAGDDWFVFSTAPGAANADQLADYVAQRDRIVLDDAVFTGLSPGALPGDAFVIGTQAQDAADRVIYDIQTGNLYYDPDGIGTAYHPVLFATVHEGTPLTAAGDFFVI